MSTPATKECVFCIHVTLGGLPVDVTFTAQMDQLPAAIARLKNLGAEPQVSAPAGAPLQRRATVTYADSGEPLCGNPNCSRHGQPLAPSQHNGYYCKGKDSKTGNSKGYCKTATE